MRSIAICATRNIAERRLIARKGRYANRIKNSTFTLDGLKYKVPANENNGADTLHGGPNGWDYVSFS